MLVSDPRIDLLPDGARAGRVMNAMMSMGKIEVAALQRAAQ